MTQIEAARAGRTTPEMERVAEEEGVSVDLIRERLKTGRVVILKNRLHDVKPVGVGEGLRVKVNANFGTSPYHMDVQEELEKLRVAVEAGADTVMDLSLGMYLNRVRLEVLKRSPVWRLSRELHRGAGPGSSAGQ